jgi:hypothetical protein
MERKTCKACATINTCRGKNNPRIKAGQKQQPSTRSQAAPCGKQAHHNKSLWSHNMAASTSHHGKHKKTPMQRTHQVHGRTTAMITRLVITQRRVITKETTNMQKPVQTRTRQQDCPEAMQKYSGPARTQPLKQVIHTEVHTHLRSGRA